MTTIIGFAGKKQSGKNACGNFIVGTVMWGLGIVKEYYGINEDGVLVVSDIYGNSEQGRGEIFLDNPNLAAQAWLAQHVYPFVRVYALADLLKEVAVTILGIDRELVYGDEDARNTETHLRWENMPGVVTPQDLMVSMVQVGASTNAKEVDGNGQYVAEICGMVVHEPGPMTVREVLQYMGTEIFRKMYEKVWVDALFRRIDREKPMVAVVTDVRFPNECDAIKEWGGHLIHLTRDVTESDGHSSENSLENYDGFTHIIDNREMTIPQQNAAVKEYLDSIEFFKIMETEDAEAQGPVGTT